MNKSKYVELEVYKDEKKRKKPLPLDIYLVFSAKSVSKHTCTPWTVNSWVINGTTA